jgi:PAS domain S-box-containing protein
MPELSWLNTGMLFFALGGVFLVLFAVVLQAWRRVNSTYLAALRKAAYTQGEATYPDAVIVVQRGGSIASLNEQARKWFGLGEYDSVSLERIARQIRPAERFLRLCVQQDVARLMVAGRIAEAISYRLADGEMMVVLRPVGSGEEQGEISEDILAAVMTFSQEIISEAGLYATLRNVFLNLLRLIPYDVAEIKVFPAEDRHRIYRLNTSDTDGRERVQEVHISQFGDLYQRALETGKPFFSRDLRSDEGGNIGIARSYIALPLQAGGRTVGVLEVGQRAASGYSRNDVYVLELVASQIATALVNALVYEEERKRAEEIAYIAELTKSVERSENLESALGHVLEVLDRLFDYQIMGVVFYDEFEHMLEAAKPFKGLSDDIVFLYRSRLERSVEVDEVLKTTDILFTRDATQSWHWQVLNLKGFAQAASIRDALLVPLRASDRLVGFLHLSNRGKTAEELDAAERQRIQLFAAQIASLLGTMLAAERLQKREAHFRVLHTFSDIVASRITIDDLLTYAMQEIVRVVPADYAAFYLLDEKDTFVSLHVNSLFGMKPDQVPQEFYRIPVDTEAFTDTVTGSRKPYFASSLDEGGNITPFYQAFQQLLDVKSVMIVPLYIREKRIGEWMLGARTPFAFSQQDLDLLETVAQQVSLVLAAALERGISFEDLDEGIQTIFQLVRSSRLLHVAKDEQSLLDVLYSEIQGILQPECGYVFSIAKDENGRASILHFAGETRQATMTPLEQAVFERQEELRIADFSRSQYAAPHEGVRSALVVPIMHRGEVLGLVYLHASKPEAFSEVDEKLVEQLAHHAGIALSNIREYQQILLEQQKLQRISQALEKQQEAWKELQPDVPLHVGLQKFAELVRQVTPFTRALISLYDEERGTLQRVAGAGLPSAVFGELRAREQSWNSVQQFLRPMYAAGRGYFIPHDRAPVIPADIHIVSLGNLAIPPEEGGWHPDDLLLFPFYDAEGHPLGLLSVDDPQNGLRPDQISLQILSDVTAHLERFIIFQKRNQAFRLENERLQAAIHRLELLQKVSAENFPTLLRKDLEQTLAVQGLARRVQRVRSGLRILDAVSRQTNVDDALRVLAQELMREFNLTYALIAGQSIEGPQLIGVFGQPPENVSMEALFGQRNPLRAALQNGTPLFSADLDDDLEWQDVSLFLSLKAKAFITLPIMQNREPVWGVMGIGSQPLQGFTQDDEQVLQQVAQQVSLIIDNLHLLVEANRNLREVQLLLAFNQQVVDLPPREAARVLLDNARNVVGKAHAGVVFLWDEQRKMLVPQAVSGYGDDGVIAAISYAAGEALPGRVFEAGRTVRIDELNFAAEYDFGVEKLMRYQQGVTGRVTGRLPVASLLVPIRAGDEVLGLVLLDNFNEPGAFSRQDEALIDSLARQVGLALENYHLVHEAQERAEQLQVLYQASVQMGASLSRQNLVEILLPALGKIVPYDTAILWLRDGNRMRVVAANGFENNEERIGLEVEISDSQLLQEMTVQRTSLVIHDTREDPRIPTFTEDPNLSWLGVPVLIGGAVEGVFALEKKEAGFYTPEYTQLANNFAAQTAVALQNALLYEESVTRATELAERSQRLALLNTFSAALSGLLDADKIYEQVMESILQSTHARRVNLVIFDGRGRAFWQQVLPAQAIALPQELPHTAIFARLQESGGILMRDNLAEDAEGSALAKVFGREYPAAMLVPFIWDDRLQSLIIIQAESRDAFSSEEIDLIRTLANQAGIALQNASLYHSVVRTAERLNILNQVSAEINATLDLETIFSTLHWATGQLLPMDAFVLALLDEEAGEIEASFIVERGKRLPVTRLPLGKGISSHVIQTGNPVLTNTAADEIQNAAVTIGSDNRPDSILAVPLMIGGKPQGVLSAQVYQEYAYNRDDLDLLMTLANQAATAINNARLFARLNQLNDELESRVIERTAELDAARRQTEFLLQAFTEVSSSLDLDHALRRTLELLNNAIGAEQGTIMMLDASEGVLRYRMGFGYASEMASPDEGLTLQPGQGLAGWVLEHRTSALVYDLLDDPRWVPSSLSGAQHRSALAVPLKVGEEILGVLMMYHREPAYFSQAHRDLAEAIASQVSIAINNANLYELIREQSEQMGKAAREQRLEASRRAAILASVVDGVLVTDEQNRIEFVNQAALRILNASEDELVGLELPAFAQRFGEAANIWMQTIRTWSEDPASYQETGPYAEQIFLPDGRVLFINLAPVLADNEFIGTVSTLRDITYEVEVDRLKSEFVATVSHELRTPMTAIRGYVDLLMMGAAGALNDNQQRFLKIIKDNTVRLNVLVNDLLDVSQLEAGQVALNIRPVDLVAAATEVIDHVRQRSVQEQKPMKFLLEAPEDLPPVAADPDRIRQILSNLVENGFRYTPEGGSVTVRVQRLGEDLLQVDVQDTGIGIAPEEQERVFERFYRGEHPFVLATAGTGLGLALTRQLVEMHHGRIWLKSVLGQGSTFSFTIPVYREEA